MLSRLHVCLCRMIRTTDNEAQQIQDRIPTKSTSSILNAVDGELLQISLRSASICGILVCRLHTYPTYSRNTHPASAWRSVLHDQNALEVTKTYTVDSNAHTKYNLLVPFGDPGCAIHPGFVSWQATSSTEQATAALRHDSRTAERASLEALLSLHPEAGEAVRSETRQDPTRPHKLLDRHKGCEGENQVNNARQERNTTELANNKSRHQRIACIDGRYVEGRKSVRNSHRIL